MIRYERGASFRYVNEIFKQLNRKDAHFVNPRGRFIDSPNVAIRYVAFDEDTGNPIGFIDGYVFEDAVDTVILVMAVLERYRKQHVALELLKYMERAASHEGYRRLLARIEHDNIPSIHMIKRFGFVHDGPIDPDDPQVHMQKLLKKGRSPSMDSFTKMRGFMVSAMEAEMAEDTNTKPVEAKFTFRNKFKAGTCKVGITVKNMFSKFAAFIKSRGQSFTEPATEIFGSKKDRNQPNNQTIMLDAAKWVIANSSRITGGNNDNCFVVGAFNNAKRTEEIEMNLSFFTRIKEELQRQGFNIGAFIINLGGTDKSALILSTFDMEDFRIITSVYYVEMLYEGSSISDIIKGTAEKFVISVMGHQLWSIVDHEQPIKDLNRVVAFGSMEFSAK